jgi:hypothetical protein
LHAGLVIRAGRCDRLAQVCRYALRPPLAQERLHRTSEGLLERVSDQSHDAAC